MVNRKYYIVIFSVIAITLLGYVLYLNYNDKKEQVSDTAISTESEVDEIDTLTRTNDSSYFEEVNTNDDSFDQILSQRSEDVMRTLEEQLDSTSLYSSDILYGCWFKPHEARYENCVFFKDHTFNMVSFGLQELFQWNSPIITGTFSQKGDSIYLENEGGWKFSLRYENMGGEWYVTKEKGGEYEIYLVKGSLN